MKTFSTPTRGIVDTSDQAQQVRVPGTKKRRRTIKERREIVEETLVPGAREAGVAHFIDQQISIPADEALLD